jgi:activating signal cointegrator 1
MKALSLWEPHATAIALGLKIYETRGWFLDYRGPLAIHAAKKLLHERDYPWDWWCEMRKRLSLAGCPLGRMSYGKITCIVDVVDCVPTATVREMAEADRKPDPKADGKWHLTHTVKIGLPR